MAIRPERGVAEDVLLVIDISTEMLEPWGESSTHTRMEIVKQNLGHFVRHKLSFNPRHRVGIWLVADDVSLVLDFTNDLDVLLSTIISLQETSSSTSFDFSTFFDRAEEV